MIMDLVDKQDRVTIATYAKDGQVTVRLTTKARTEEEGFREILPLQNEIASRLKEALYSTEDEELEYVRQRCLLTTHYNSNCRILYRWADFSKAYRCARNIKGF